MPKVAKKAFNELKDDSIGNVSGGKGSLENFDEDISEALSKSANLLEKPLMTDSITMNEMTSGSSGMDINESLNSIEAPDFNLKDSFKTYHKTQADDDLKVQRSSLTKILTPKGSYNGILKKKLKTRKQKAAHFVYSKGLLSYSFGKDSIYKTKDEHMSRLMGKNNSALKDEKNSLQVVEENQELQVSNSEKLSPSPRAQNLTKYLIEGSAQSFVNKLKSSRKNLQHSLNNATLNPEEDEMKGLGEKLIGPSSSKEDIDDLIIDFMSQGFDSNSLDANIEKMDCCGQELDNIKDEIAELFNSIEQLKDPSRHTKDDDSDHGTGNGGGIFV